MDRGVGAEVGAELLTVPARDTLRDSTRHIASVTRYWMMLEFVRHMTCHRNMTAA